MFRVEIITAKIISGKKLKKLEIKLKNLQEVSTNLYLLKRLYKAYASFGIKVGGLKMT